MTQENETKLIDAIVWALNELAKLLIVATKRAAEE